MTSEKPGLQVERTELSWQRTGFSFLAVSAVLLFHTQVDRLGPGRIVLALLTTVLALSVFAIGRYRGRLTVADADATCPAIRSPAIAVTVTGWATPVLATLILLAAMLPGV